MRLQKYDRDQHSVLQRAGLNRDKNVGFGRDKVKRGVMAKSLCRGERTGFQPEKRQRTTAQAHRFGGLRLRMASGSFAEVPRHVLPLDATPLRFNLHRMA